MIDIIEAGKFYNDCLKKVKEATLKENILPENTVLNAKADLMQHGGRMCKTVVGAFELNNVDYMFEADIDRNDRPCDIVHKTTSAIANVVAEAIIRKIDWSEIDK
ncbi:hypothetical protein LCGC14_0448190 [marine sediment metagenome]|uniref:Uncharacterized protein n=1 Tax=marine sediment metagenome TaxID=412755 RepID=A0A0F9SPC5_9ZZZZ